MTHRFCGRTGGGRALGSRRRVGAEWIGSPPLCCPRQVAPGSERTSVATRPGRRAAAISALGVLVFAIIEAPDRGWTSEPTLLLAVDAALFVAFIMWERRHHAPMVGMALFRNARFTAATSTMTLIFFTMYGVVFLLTQYLELVLGSLSATLRLAQRVPSDAGARSADAARASYVDAFHATLLVAAGTVVVTALVVGRVLRPSPKTGPQTEPERRAICQVDAI